MALPPRRIILTTLAVRRWLKQLADALVPPEVSMFDISTCMGANQVAAAIAKLGIADALGDRALTAEEVAAQSGTDPDTTHRLLRNAVSYGLCRMNPRTGRVTLTRTGGVLRSDHPQSLREWTIYMGLRHVAEAWSDLARSVRTGESSFPAVHGMSIWEWFATHPEEERLFASAMRGATTINADTIVQAYPWPRGGVVCDVAGGVGTLLSTIIAKSDADLRGVLVDGPGVIAEAEDFLKARGVAHRIDAVAGNIFDAITATADVYLLKDILHDWDDERCRKILSTVAATMPSGSRLLLVEVIQQPNTPNPMAPFVDLLMLTQTDGGRQRSINELATLLTEAGLRPTGTVRHAIPHDLVEAVKP